MEIKRRTEILIETRREIVVGGSDSSGQTICPQCGGAMLAAEHAVVSGVISDEAKQLSDGEKI